MTERCSRTRLSLRTGLLIALVFAGCSGDPEPPTMPESGSVVQMQIRWPRVETHASRYLPSYAASIVLEMHREDRPDVRFALVADRPESDSSSTTTVRFAQLIPAGRYQLAGVARSLPGGNGGTVASGATAIDVPPGTTFEAHLVLQSTLTHLDITGQPLRFPVNYRFPLSVSATDPAGRPFVIPGSALSWRLTSGDGIAELSSAGVLTSTSPGSVSIEVREVGAGLRADGTVEIHPWPTPGEIWVHSSISPSQVGFVTAESGFSYTEIGRAAYEGIGVRIFDIAWSPGPDRALYACDDQGWLYVIETDPFRLVRGARMPEVVNSLVWGVDRRLYGAAEIRGNSVTGRLLEIDPLSGQTRLIGFFPGRPAGDLDFHPRDGMLYLTTLSNDGSHQLLRIDPRTGTPSRVAELPGTSPAVAYSDGVFYIVTSGNQYVYSVDLEDGATTLLADGIGGDFRSVGGASAVLP